MSKREKIKSEYFDWLVSKVFTEREASNFSQVLSVLNDTIFTCDLPMDLNRAEDGKRLRDIYLDELDTRDSYIIDIMVDEHPCSILEMMVALAIRCEDDIMRDYDEGDRTGLWFWIMFENLGLSEYEDDNFDESRVNWILARFLKRTYEKDGKGSLFYIPNTRCDMREIEIWYQMSEYINTMLSDIDFDDDI